jgi:hypothetical protein
VSSCEQYDGNELNEGVDVNTGRSGACCTPATPLRKAEANVLLQTPTRTGHSPGLCRESPSFNMTPTKTPPSVPLRVKKSAGLLRTPTTNAPSPVTTNAASPSVRVQTQLRRSRATHDRRIVACLLVNRLGLAQQDIVGLPVTVKIG